MSERREGERVPKEFTYKKGNYEPLCEICGESDSENIKTKTRVLESKLLLASIQCYQLERKITYKNIY